MFSSTTLADGVQSEVAPASLSSSSAIPADLSPPVHASIYSPLDGQAQELIHSCNRSQSPEISANSYQVKRDEQESSLAETENGSLSPLLPLDALPPVPDSPTLAVDNHDSIANDETKDEGVRTAVVTTSSSGSELSSVDDDWDEE